MLIERIIAAAVIMAAALVGVDAVRPEAGRTAAMAVAIPITATPLPLNRDDPGQHRIGALRFRGAVQLRSSNALFGGWSGLRAGPGLHMLAVSDTGNWLAFETVERGDRLIGVSNGFFAPILAADGQPPHDKAAGDAEALEWNPATGDASITYEQQHRIAHFTGVDASPASLARGPASIEYLTAMTGWPANGGGEATAILPGGARIIISEVAKRRDGAHQALLTRGGVTREIGVEGLAGFSPTDAIAIDDHRILVLHRMFSPLRGLGAALTLVDLAPVLGGSPDGAALAGRLLARWAPPLTLDNMEGLALRRQGDRLFLYFVSDDNLNSLQRTVLMKFEIDGAALDPGA